jgi:hypothetical protein
MPSQQSLFIHLALDLSLPLSTFTPRVPQPHKMRLLPGTLFVHLAAASQAPLSSQDQYGPSIATAQEDANFIFNSIHS